MRLRSGVVALGLVLAVAFAAEAGGKRQLVTVDIPGPCPKDATVYKLMRRTLNGDVTIIAVDCMELPKCVAVKMAPDGSNAFGRVAGAPDMDVVHVEADPCVPEPPDPKP